MAAIYGHVAALAFAFVGIVLLSGVYAPLASSAPLPKGVAGVSITLQADLSCVDDVGAGYVCNPLAALTPAMITGVTDSTGNFNLPSVTYSQGQILATEYCPSTAPTSTPNVPLGYSPVYQVFIGGSMQNGVLIPVAPSVVYCPANLGGTYVFSFNNVFTIPTGSGFITVTIPAGVATSSTTTTSSCSYGTTCTTSTSSCPTVSSCIIKGLTNSQLLSIPFFIGAVFVELYARKRKE